MSIKLGVISSEFQNEMYDFFSRKLRPEDQIQYTITEKKDKRVTKAHVNAVFFRQLRELLRKFCVYF